ncbi:MAG: aminopeptidase N [Nocardioidaceae bacterium]
MSLTLVEARARAATISEVSYDIALDLTDRESFRCRTVVSFSSTAADSFLELHAARDLRVEGASWSYDGARISLTGLGGRHRVVVEARLPYVTDGEGMHTFTDPADAETYVGAYCGMDLAQRVFPCFDQNDLKAPLALEVVAPPAWTVLANGRVTERDGGRWVFAATPPVPVALFIVAGGPFASVTWEHAGLPFGWHARASLAPSLERDAAWLRRTTEACFDHYARIFDEPYPFDSYDQAFVPGLNWGAQEMPGCISYRDEFLPLGEPTEPERRDLAMVIAHEMAHMWFGDLVTMTWWEDTWLQESFAEYLGFRVAEDAVGLPDTMTDFTIGWEPRAYQADERRSTHPVAPRPEDVPDVEVADGNFDSLSYAKGSAVLRQLVTWLGDDTFLAGVNAYLTRHRFANASLADFVGALDEVSDRDVHAWSEQWLRTTGFDTLRVTRSDAGLTVARDGFRSHRLRLTSLDDSMAEVGSQLVDLADRPVTVPAVAALLPNALGETYARVRPDPASWALLTARLSGLARPGERAIVWTTGFDLALSGELAPVGLLDLVVDQLPLETHPSTVAEVVDWVRTVLLPRFVVAADASTVVARLAEACRSALSREPSPEIAVQWARALAATSADTGELRTWLSSGLAAGGVVVDPTLRWLALHRLAALGGAEADELAAARAADGTVVGALGEARALAARPSLEAKEAAWSVLVDDPSVSNRTFSATAEGLWDVEQSDLVEPWVRRYAAATVDLARDRGPSFAALAGRAFPRLHLRADQVALFEEQLLRDDVPTVLRRTWEDAVDDCRRAVQS